MKKVSYYDCHCDALIDCWRYGKDLVKKTGQVSLERKEVFARWAQTFALYGHYKIVPAEKLPQLYEELYAILLSALERRPDLAGLCRRSEEIEQTTAEGKMAAVLSIEGAELISCDPANLEKAARRGVRYINLTWNFPNVLSGTNVNEPERGLSDQGKEFVKEMYRLGMLPDVSHISDPAFWDIAEMGLGPVFASHSNLRSVHFHTRSLTDDMFRAIVQTGGTAGLNLYDAFISDTGSFDDLCRHLDHALELGGEKAIAMGGDLDGCETLAAGMKGVEDIPGLYERLLVRGYGEELLDDMFWNNSLNLLKTMEKVYD